MNEPYYCPVNGWDCPYFDANGVCMMDNPLAECDDAAAMEACLNDDSDSIYIFGTNIEDIVDEILNSPPMGMVKIEIHNPNWEE